MKLLRMKALRTVFLLSFLVSGLMLKAQSDPTGASPVTSTYAITNATVVQSPGKEVKGTVVIKNGLIQAVGSNAQVPNDAQVIDGTGLYVYAGFIDGLSNTAAKRPDNPERPRDLFTPDPPNEYAGITPENSVLDQLDVTSNTIDGLRKVGFSISNTAPYGRMLPGSTSLILLSDVKDMDNMVLLPNNMLYAQWVGAPGAYPGNILGIMAKWRNLYRNAVNDKAHEAMYAENPSGLTRPANDRVSEAFYPVINGTKPVLFDVGSMLDVRRAFRLQKDLGFKLVVGGVEQAWEIVDELKATNTPIFLSLDVPDEPKPSKEKDQSDEFKALEARKMEFYKIYASQAAELEKAGVTFGFATKGIRTGDIKKNIMTMMDNGLSETAALAALTTGPASIFGISQIAGTVEAGKQANLMISNAPYFTKDSQIKMMFVDGNIYEYEIKEVKKGNGEAAGGPTGAATAGDPVVGSWSYTFSTPQGEQGGKMIIKRENGALSGTITSSSGAPDSDMNNLNFSNGELSFDYGFDAGGQSIEIVVVGTVTGTQYEAEASIAAFNVSFPMTATKDGAKNLN